MATSLAVLEGWMSRYCRVFIFLMAAVGAQMVRAEPDFLDVINKKYSIVDSSMLGQKSCAMCHISDEDYGFNLYGKQLAQQMTSQNAKTLDDAILAAIGGQDADSDGVNNDEEFKAGTDPAKSDKPGSPEPPVASTPAPEKPLIPKNGYHPAIVHFPIALLIAGLLLDLAGLITKKSNLLYAGWYNLVLGAITSLGALASGFLAMMLMKLPYKGLIFTHLKLAVIVTVLMWLMVLLRVHRHEKMNLGARVIYYGLAVAAFLIISYTGHLGGVFVYGE